MQQSNKGLLDSVSEGIRTDIIVKGSEGKDYRKGKQLSEINANLQYSEKCLLFLNTSNYLRKPLRHPNLCTIGSLVHLGQKLDHAVQIWEN